MAEIEPTGNAKVALDLAAAGFSVFPCHAGGEKVKSPMPGVMWRSQSTTDRVKVAGWWRRWPNEAVGLDVGKCGLLIIDADRHGGADGVAAIAALFDEHQFDPNTVPVVSTPNSGTHFYFRMPNGVELGNGRGGLPPGIDVRGIGGFAIAPGTVMADGRRYEMFGSILDAPIAPDWLIEIIRSPAKGGAQPAPAMAPVLVPAGDVVSDERVRAYAEAALGSELEAVGTAPRGHRNHQLNTSAFAIGQMVGAGWLGEGRVVALLEQASFALAQDDGIISVRKTIASGLRAGQRQPRQMPESDYRSEGLTAEDYAIAAQLQVGGETIDPATGEVLGEEVSAEETLGGAVDYFDAPDAMLRPAGLVGALTDWICDWASEPVRIHAVGAALVIVGTLIGRKVMTRSKPLGPALYVGALTPSGVGKQHPIDCIRLALDTAIGGPRTVAPIHMGWHTSLPSLVHALMDRPTRTMIVDEFAEKLMGLRSRNAALSTSAISEALRSLWGATHSSYAPDMSISASARGVGEIKRPILSMYGAATLKEFARALVSKDLSNGLFNRFLILPRHAPVASQPEREEELTVPERIADQLVSLYNCLNDMGMASAVVPDSVPADTILVSFDADAAAMHEANRLYGKAMLAMSDNDDALALYGRFAEQIKRVALIVACGRRPLDLRRAIICAEDMHFARGLVEYAINQFVLMVRREMVENDAQRNHKMLLDIIRSAGKDGLSRSQLTRKVKGRLVGKAYSDTLQSLVDGLEIVEEAVDKTAGKRGPMGCRYRVRAP